MFFPKLRRRAKWVFLFLALAFAAGFVFFGVGAGGSGIGDYFSDLFGRNPSVSGPSVENAQKRVEENPNDAAAHLALAQALQADGKIDQAIGEYERYTSLKPRDADAMRALAALYGQKVAEAGRAVDRANADVQEATLQQQLAPSTPFAQELTNDKIAGSVAALAQERLQTAQTRLQQYASSQTAVYDKLTLIVRDDPLLFLQFAQAAETAQDYASAIAAYKQFIELSPNDPSVKQVRERIKLLESFSGGSG